MQNTPQAWAHTEPKAKQLISTYIRTLYVLFVWYQCKNYIFDQVALTKESVNYWTLPGSTQKHVQITHVYTTGRLMTSPSWKKQVGFLNFLTSVSFNKWFANDFSVLGKNINFFNTLASRINIQPQHLDHMIMETMIMSVNWYSMTRLQRRRW